MQLQLRLLPRPHLDPPRRRVRVHASPHAARPATTAVPRIISSATVRRKMLVVQATTARRHASTAVKWATSRANARTNVRPGRRWNAAGAITVAQPATCRPIAPNQRTTARATPVVKKATLPATARAELRQKKRNMMKKSMKERTREPFSRLFVHYLLLNTAMRRNLCVACCCVLIRRGQKFEDYTHSRVILHSRTLRT